MARGFALSAERLLGTAPNAVKFSKMALASVVYAALTSTNLLPIL